MFISLIPGTGETRSWFLDGEEENLSKNEKKATNRKGIPLYGVVVICNMTWAGNMCLILMFSTLQILPGC